MKDRVLYYDVAKALAIFCVIIGDVYCVHAPAGKFAPVSTFVHTFHTSLFMFISGVFFKKALEKDIKTIVIGKIRQLLIPYLSWSVILLFVVNIPSDGIDNISTTIGEFLRGGALKNYWYLKALFVYVVVTYCLIKFLNNDIIGCIAAFLLFTFAPSIFYSALFIPYFISGFLYGKYMHKIRCWKWILLLIIPVIVIYLLWIPEYNYNIGESLSIKPYLIRTTIGILDSVIVLTILRIFSNGASWLKSISVIGQYTLGMYCCNCLFYEGLAEKFLTNVMVQYAQYNNEACVIISILTFLMSYLLCRLFAWNKYTSLLFLGNKLNRTKQLY